MDAFILITILTVCGIPQSAFFINTKDQSVVGIELDTVELNSVAESQIKRNPGLELDVGKAAELRCT